MFRKPIRNSVFCALALSASTVHTYASAQIDESPATTAPAANRVGEVTANDVYVRSGDSTNHYTVCKLNADDRVTIVSERGEWYEILPPAGTFSLVSGDYVDSADGKTGVINGDNVRVRAGSLLNDNKYTVQGMLNKGEAVTILGPNPEGFLRIQPPVQATLWINRQYVQPPGAGAIMANVPQSAAGGTENSAGAHLSSPTTPTLRPAKSDTMPPAGSKWRDQLREIDIAAKVELAKAPAERDLSAAIAQYRPIAEQTDDEYAKQYATARLSELENVHALNSAIANVRNMGEQAEARRREYLEGRATIPPAETEPIPTGIEIHGELRVSALYPPGSSVRRYRLIDPAAERDRTLAYVEIPAELPLKMEDFIGHYVGVRASERRLQKGGVNPVPIYIATELILLQPPKLDSAQATSKNTP